MVFKPSDVLIGGRPNIGEAAQHIQWRGRFSAIHTGERSHPRALMDGATESQQSGGEDLLTVGGILVAENAEHGIEVAVSSFRGVRLGIVCWSERKPDVGTLEGLLQDRGPKVGGIVGMYLDRMSKSGEN